MPTTIVTATTILLDQFLTDIQTSITDLNFVYDEQLSFDTAIERYRTENQIQNLTQDAFPLFVFNRSQLQRTELGRRVGRSVIPQKVDDPSSQVEKFKSGLMKLVLNFQYIDINMQNVESFETLYMFEESINKNKVVTIDLPGIGSFGYSLYWEDLEEITINIENTYYKGFSSSVAIQGVFFLTEGDFKFIRTKDIGWRHVPKSVDLDDIDNPV